MQPNISRTALSSHTETGMAGQQKRENVTQHGGGQEPGKHILLPLIPYCSPKHTRWGGFINVKPAVIAREFPYQWVGMDTSAPSEQQTGKFIHFKYHEQHTLERMAPVRTQVGRSAGSCGWGWGLLCEHSIQRYAKQWSQQIYLGGGKA